ncbi:hypothetical protein ACROYT_G012562 [Oculina patagonica]
MVVVACSVPGCKFKTSDVSEPPAIALLGNHSLAHQSSVAQSTPAALQGPKLERPKINVGVSIEDWNVFLRRWEVFRKGSNINEASSPSQLFQCAGAELGDSLLTTNPNFASESLEQLLATLAVIPVATCVLRTDLLQLRQECDEAIRAFAARVRGKQKPAPSQHSKDRKEMARNALPSSTLSAVSTFQKQCNTAPVTAPPQADRNKEATCPDCKKTFKIFTEGARGWNTQPHQVCINCYRVRRRRKHNKFSPQDPSPNIQALEADPISQGKRKNTGSDNENETPNLDGTDILSSSSASSGSAPSDGGQEEGEHLKKSLTLKISEDILMTVFEERKLRDVKLHQQILPACRFLKVSGVRGHSKPTVTKKLAKALINQGYVVISSENLANK